ncbi:MAG: peptidylprolyl isomerase, partial [Bacteroidota bacterium]
EVGAIYGPYVEGTAYKLAKLVDREVVADSANTRHILISASTPEQFETAEATVDSLMGVIRRGGSWDELAEEFSQDPGSKDNGGLYEGVTPGQFVKPYDDIIFRTGNLRQLYSVRSQFGMHLVEVLKRSSTSSPRVKVAYVQEDIVPSSDTENTVLERAQLFLADNQNLEALQAAAANDPNLTVRQSAPLTVNSYRIPELGNNGGEIRDIACWAFSADVGDTDGRVYTFTDPQLYYENRHVIIALSSIVPKGLAPVASVRDDLTPVVANQLKGEQLRRSIAGKDLLAVAQQFNVEVDTVNNVNLTMVNLPGLGREPKVIAAAFRTGAQQVSSPIVGETGVYIVKPLNEINTTTSGSLPTARQSIQSRNRSQVTSQLLNSMRSGVELDDRRASLECQ